MKKLLLSVDINPYCDNMNLEIEGTNQHLKGVQNMAYINQEEKKEIVKIAKPILKKYNMKGSFKITNHSTLVLTLKSGPLDLIGNYIENAKPEFNVQCRSLSQVSDKLFSGKCLDFMMEMHNAMNGGNHNNSDLMTDYYDVGWYTSINIGDYGKFYIVTD